MDKQKLSGNEKTVLAVTYDITTDRYTIGTCKGSSVSELAFVVMVLAKTLERDGHIKNTKEFMDKVQRYMDDPQFEEVKDEDRN